MVSHPDRDMRASIIIPTRGRPTLLSEALSSLLAENLPASDTEVVVVDNDPDAASSGELRAACTSAGPPVRYVPEPSPGQTAARHRGGREASGEILIYTDDDIRVAPGWLAAMLDAFDDPGVGMAGGPSVPSFAGPVPAWLWSFVQPTPYGGWHCGWLSLIDIGRSVPDIEPNWIWGLNLAIRKDVLEKAGGFHPDVVPPKLQRWQGDGETGLAYRVQALGVAAAYTESALVQHIVPAKRLTVDAFASRGYYQGVCDSFTSIRAGSPPDTDAAPDSHPVPLDSNPWSVAASEVRTATLAAYNRGWTDHQREAARDPLLVNWIRRKGYWDADIREEMRKHTPA
jgi:glycosyltransferase involved in cell wall biosynthesis